MTGPGGIGGGRPLDPGLPAGRGGGMGGSVGSPEPGIPPGAARPGPGDDLLEGLRSGSIRGDDARLEAAADLLESSFFQELFKAMRATVPDDGLTSGGRGEEIFSSLLDQHLAEVSASRSEGGVGAALYRRFTALAGGGGEP